MKKIEECWKDIKGYEGLYQISNLGRVKVLGRWYSVRQKSYWIEKKQIMSPWSNGFGYLVVALRKNKQRKNHYVHRLVAEHFLSNPLNKKQVNHLDYNKCNNDVRNLEWVTPKENTEYSRPNFSKQHTCKTKTGERYISQRKSNGKYRVSFYKKHIDKQFTNLSDAVAFRDKMLKHINYL